MKEKIKEINMFQGVGVSEYMYYQLLTALAEAGVKTDEELGICGGKDLDLESNNEEMDS